MGIDLSKINKAFTKIAKDNEDAVIDLETYQDIPRVPTRSPELNKILGGGIPFRIMSISGMESHGKSLLSYVIARALQDAGIFVVFLDYECTFSESFAMSQGLITTPDKFKLLRPATITEGFDIVSNLLEAGIRGFVWDSLALAPSQRELDGDFGDSNMGVRAREISQGMTKLVPLFNKYQAVFLILNHLKVDLTVKYGDNQVEPGGRAVPFASSIRMRVRRTEYIKQGEEPIGFKMAVRTIKNKCFAPNKTCELTFMYDTGLDTTGGVIDEFCDLEIINRGGGGNFSFNDLTGELVKIRGKAKLIEYFKENNELFEEFKQKAGLKLPEDSDIIE